MIQEEISIFTEAEFEKRINMLQRHWNHDKHTAAENADMWEALEKTAVISLVREWLARQEKASTL